MSVKLLVIVIIVSSAIQVPIVQCKVNGSFVATFTKWKILTLKLGSQPLKQSNTSWLLRRKCLLLIVCPNIWFLVVLQIGGIPHDSNQVINKVEHNGRVCC